MATFFITAGVILLTLRLIAHLTEKRVEGGERSGPPLTLLPGDIKYDSPNLSSPVKCGM